MRAMILLRQPPTWREFFLLVLAQDGAKVLGNLEEPGYRACWMTPCQTTCGKREPVRPALTPLITHLVQEGWMHNHEVVVCGLPRSLAQDRLAGGLPIFREHLFDLVTSPPTPYRAGESNSAPPYHESGQHRRSTAPDAGATPAPYSLFRGEYESIEG
jgi:hypothetical protein